VITSQLVEQAVVLMSISVSMLVLVGRAVERKLAKRVYFLRPIIYCFAI